MDVNNISFVLIVIVCFCTNLFMVLWYNRVDKNHECSFLELFAKQNAANKTSGVVGIKGKTVPIIPKPRLNTPITI